MIPQVNSIADLRSGLLPKTDSILSIPESSRWHRTSRKYAQNGLVLPADLQWKETQSGDTAHHSGITGL